MDEYGSERRAEVDVSVIIANYNTRDLLERNLRSIYENPPRCAFEVIVADDASRDGSAAMARERFPQAVVRENEVNQGYARNNNAAMAAARGRYIYLLNSDAVVLPGTLDTLVEFMDANPKVGGAGSLIYNEDGSVQASVKALPSVRSAFVGKRSWAYRLFPNSPIVRNELLVTEGVRENTPPFRAGYVSSASLILPKAVFERVGGLDPRLWWFVDADYCKRIHDLEREIWCVPAARIIHLDHRGGTVGTRRRRFWAVYKFHQGVWIYWRRHSGRSLWHPATLAIGAALLTRTAVSAVLQVAKELTGREDRY